MAPRICSMHYGVLKTADTHVLRSASPSFRDAQFWRSWVSSSFMLKKILSAAVIACVFAACIAHAQSYPVRPIRMLVGFTPAGPTDLTARLAAQYLSEALGQQVIVDNRPGAGGTVAGALLAQSAPDGYTIALGANGEIAISPNLR